jgi:hypothetical membrane protein
MAAYPGGTFTDGSTVGYDFFRNFFSDLGRVTAPNGQPNTVSLILFFTALNLVGIGLILFFLAFRDFFISDRMGSLLSLLGSVIGVISGLCFVGIAWAPYDLFFNFHYELVFWAFRAFFISIAIYTLVIFRQDTYPRRHGWIFVAFTILLASYIGLLEFGPKANTAAGAVIQPTGQKIITYISIISIMAQSRLAYRVNHHEA